MPFTMSARFANGDVLWSDSNWNSKDFSLEWSWVKDRTLPMTIDNKKNFKHTLWANLLLKDCPDDLIECQQHRVVYWNNGNTSTPELRNVLDSVSDFTSVRHFSKHRHRFSEVEHVTPTFTKCHEDNQFYPFLANLCAHREDSIDFKLFVLLKRVMKIDERAGKRLFKDRKSRWIALKLVEDAVMMRLKYDAEKIISLED